MLRVVVVAVCPTCSGTGVIYGMPCADCHASGQTHTELSVQFDIDDLRNVLAVDEPRLSLTARILQKFRSKP